MMRGKMESFGSANNGTSSHIDYRGTTYDNSTRYITEGVKEGSTTYGMSTRETIEGTEIGN
jgi:hypothetical protein